MPNKSSISTEEKIRAVTVMPEPSSEFVESLWQQLADLPQPKPSFGDHLSRVLRPAMLLPVVATIVVVVLFLLVGPQRVMAAIEMLFNYLPGVGLVNHIDQAAILAEPVQQERGAYTVTVENMVSSPERTWLRIKVDGWHESPDFINHPDRQPGWPYLQLSDGQAIQANQGDTYIGDALYAEYQFPPLPASTKAVHLLLSQIPLTLKGDAPDSWDFTLNLRQAEPKDVLPEAWRKLRTSPMVNGVSMQLLQIVQEVDSTYLTIRFDTPTLNDTLSTDWFSQLSLKDAQGHIYPLRFEKGIGGRSALFQTRPFTGQENLHLQLNRLLLVDEPQNGSAPGFTLDFGSAPHIGQRLSLDQTLKQGAHQIHIVGVVLESSKEGRPVLAFELVPSAGNIQSALLRCSQPICDQSTRKPSSIESGAVPQPVIELKELPVGELHVELGLISYAIDGPWSIDWQTPLLTIGLRTQATITAVPTTALSDTPVPAPTTNTSTTTSYLGTLADEVRALLEKGFQTLYGQAGWIHVVYENEESNINGALTRTLGETWQYMEPDGTISKQVWIEKTPDGAIRQKIARVGKTEVNFTTGTAAENASLQTKAQINNLPDLILRSTLDGNVLKEEKIVDGEPYQIITLQERHDPAIEITPLTKRVTLGQYKTWINQETGFVWMTQIIYRFEDGTELINQTMRYSTMERITQSPQEVLDLLEQVLP